jgi:hypothetical protein
MIVRYAVANTPYVCFQKSNTSPIYRGSVTESATKGKLINNDKRSLKDKTEQHQILFIKIIKK